jgi:hypothetical protein
LKPSDSCRDEGRAERQEENPDETAQRRKLLVRGWIERPDTIKSRASPEQSSCGETRHDGTKEQENADRRKTSRFRPDSVPHLLIE